MGQGKDRMDRARTGPTGPGTGQVPMGQGEDKVPWARTRTGSHGPWARKGAYGPGTGRVLARARVSSGQGVEGSFW